MFFFFSFSQKNVRIVPSNKLRKLTSKSLPMHNPLTHFQATTIASQIPYLNR